MQASVDPDQIMARKIAKWTPGLQIAAQAVGLQDHQGMLADHRQRVRDSHNLGMKLLGGDSSEGGEEVGDIHIGDINFAPANLLSNAGQPAGTAASPSGSGIVAASAATPSAAGTTEAAPINPDSSSWLKPLLTGLGIFGSGLGGALAGSQLNKPATQPPAIVTPAPQQSAPDFSANDYTLQLVPNDSGK